MPLPPAANPFFRVTIDRERLVDEMVAYLHDSAPSRNGRDIVRALDDLHPESVDVLEAMLLDGAEDREDVAAYVAAVFGE